MLRRNNPIRQQCQTSRHCRSHIGRCRPCCYCQPRPATAPYPGAYPSCTRCRLSQRRWTALVLNRPCCANALRRGVRSRSADRTSSMRATADNLPNARNDHGNRHSHVYQPTIPCCVREGLETQPTSTEQRRSAEYKEPQTEQSNSTALVGNNGYVRAECSKNILDANASIHSKGEANRECLIMTDAQPQCQRLPGP
jgi:hypothetical protein